MLLLSRYVITRFVANFVLLMALLFVFAISIDVFIQLHRFVEAAKGIRGPEVGSLTLAGEVIALIVDFQAPRIFQFYAYMHGLVAIGAIGFTLGTMHTRRELVAVLAAGVSMHRIAQPLLIAVFALSVLQVLNQEFIIPRIAPLLIRDQGAIGRRGAAEFPIHLTRDGRGNLLQAASFDAPTATLEAPLIIERDQTGRTVRRIVADRAIFNDRENEWILVNGQANWLITPPSPPPEGEERAASSADGGAAVPSGRTPIESYRTDLTPEALTIRRYGQFATMLSLKQISELANSPGVVDADALARYKYSRFSSVLVNLLVATIALPFFLLREPVGLMRQSLLCAGVTIPAMLGATVGVTMPLPGIPPAAGVFIPVIILLPIAIGRIAYIKT
jgi:lipopolysaccharide export LptBFGC system permease protein LptF